MFFGSPRQREEPINSHPYVCVSVRTESVHRNFLKFDTKVGLPNAIEMTFSDFGRKIPFDLFWVN